MPAVQYNLRSPAVKRILQEARQLQQDPPDEFVAAPLEDDIFEWHFTIRGPPDTEFEGGVYHGRILLSPEYPMKPPTIIMLTPSGRFEVNQKICLSVTNHHPEFWRPAWGIRTVCMALITFFPTSGAGAIGALDYSPEERRKYAQKSHSFVCPRCADNEHMVLKPLDASVPRRPIDPKSAELEGFDLSFKYEESKKKEPEQQPEEERASGATACNSAAGIADSPSDNLAAAATASASASAAPLPTISTENLGPAKLVPSPSPVPSGDLVTPDTATPDHAAAAAPSPAARVPLQRRPLAPVQPSSPRPQQQQQQQQIVDSSGWADRLIVALIFAVLAFLISKIGN